MELTIKFQNNSELSVLKGLFANFGKNIKAEIVNDTKNNNERKSDYFKYSNAITKTYLQNKTTGLVSDIRTDVALNLFKKNILTLGQASEFANLYQVEFMNLLSEQQIPIHYDEEELERDLQNIQLI